jgi:glycine C-acetyltransferase
MSDIHELKFLQEQIQELKDQGLYRKLPVVQSANEAEIIVDGHRVINLSSNNYLGFANHPRLKEAAIAGIRGRGGSRQDHCR